MENTMSLIDRYIHEVGRHLPRKSREDILAELQSLLIDTLEDRCKGDPTEEDIVALLEEFGDPKKVAASYYPEGQYLIGPTLFPIFRMVVGIVIVAVLGAQAVAAGVGMIFNEVSFNPVDFFAGVINSIPAAVGSVVIVFAILQWFGVRTEVEESPWKPDDLPELTEFENVARWEQIVGIAGGVFILVLLTLFPDKIGFVNHPGGEFFANPVILTYRGWISAVLVLSIGLESYLLWQGRWQTITRVSKVVLNFLSIALLILLVQGHTAWLNEAGASGFFSDLAGLSEGSAGIQVIGMQAFRLAFGIALVVTAIETVSLIFRLIRVYTRQDFKPVTVALGGNSSSGEGNN
jgi:hypothetical protein